MLAIISYISIFNDMLYDEIVEISEIGEDEVFDIINYESVSEIGTFEHEGHFIVDDIVVHNCIPEYVQRRDDHRQLWKEGEHPEIAKELSDTHGIIVYQEQLQKIWQKFGGFTAPEAEKARKAVAKKWTDQLKNIEEKWKVGASKTLGPQWADTMWERMVSFGRYAFNKCLSKNTILNDPVTGKIATVDELRKTGIGGFHLLSEKDGIFVVDMIDDIIDCGEQDVFEVELDNGVKQYVTLEHKFKCEDGQYRTVKKIIESGCSIVVSS